jgi:hypothetical protein
MTEKDVILAMLKRLEDLGQIYDLTVDSQDGRVTVSYGRGPYTEFEFDEHGVCVRHGSGF